MKKDNAQIIEKIAELQTSHDIEGILALFDDKFVFEDVALNLVVKSRADLKKMFEDIYSSMPDYTMTLTSAFADENHGNAEWIMSGSYVNEFPELPAASGKSFSLRAASIIRFRQGRISRWNDYWSVATFENQVKP